MPPGGNKRPRPDDPFKRPASLREQRCHVRGCPFRGIRCPVHEPRLGPITTRPPDQLHDEEPELEWPDGAPPASSGLLP
jgi:hypothetical protein